MEVRQVDTAEYLSEIIEILRQGREVSIPVKGNSMAPFLRERRDAVLLGLFSRKPNKGDVVLYRRSNGQYVLHRIFRRDKNQQYYMEGDAQNWVEGPIEREQIKALAVKFRRKGKWIGRNNVCALFFRILWPFKRHIRGIWHYGCRILQLIKRSAFCLLKKSNIE